MEYLQNLNFTHEYWMLILPLILMLIDIITGYYNAWEKKQVSSSKMRDGLGKKMAELCYIVVGILFAYAFDLKVVEVFISLYVIYMELISVAENCKKLGVSMPTEIEDKLNNRKEDE